MRYAPRVNARAIVCCTALASTGCYLSHERGDGTARRDAGCTPIGLADAGTIRPEQVDLLFLVDNSNSMSQEQASLARALPSFVEALVSGDVDLDGTRDFTPVGSLQLGVVTSDMGTGGFTVPTCAMSDFGDDGLLRRSSTSGDPMCPLMLPAFLTYDPMDGVMPAAFAREAACLTTTGTGGCGFEQQLEAVLKAVTPSTSPIRFFRDTRGHGDGPHRRFVRPDSILVVVMVTDENDCSALDPGIFDPRSDRYSADLNLRCFSYPTALHPIERYVDGLLALRASEPGRLVYATIAGIPPDRTGSSAEEILADPRMREMRDPETPGDLAPSCTDAERGVAYPPRRLLEVGIGLSARGARTVHLSICQDDFSPAVSTVLEEIAAAARPICR